jgi:fatty acid desaturase
VGSHGSIGWALGAAWAFSLVNHLPFSLLHEAVHGIFSRNARVNELFGVLSAAAFPTSFTMQRVAHLGHHRRNRTDRELYDYYLPSQSRALRNLWLYAGNLFGLYWFLIPLSNLVYLLFPFLYASRWFVQGPARVLGFEPYVEEIVKEGKLRIWLECLLALVYQMAVFVLLDLNWRGWLLCHGAFALHWSALQYVDHAWSPRDVINGAWNLRVLPLTRALALNYHHHLAHHQHPSVPWIHLSRLVDRGAYRPTFWAIYFSLWGGTRPAPPMGEAETSGGFVD